MYRLHSNGNYWTAVFTHQGVTYRKSLGSKAAISKRSAQRLIDQLVAKHVEEGVDNTVSRTLGEWLDRYLVLREYDLAKSSRFIHERVCESLVAFFGADAPLHRIDRVGLSDWRSLERRTRAESTVCKYSRTAKVIFARAVDEEWIETSPALKLRGTAPTIDPFSRRLVTQEEVDEVLQFPGSHLACVAIGWYAGLRTAEIINLEKADFQTQEGKIIVRTRGRLQTSKQRGREVRLEPDLVSRIAKSPVGSSRNLGSLAELATNPHETICGLIENGKKNMVARYVKQACEAAGVNPFTLRDLRRARDTIWHSKYPSHVCCAWLGHSESVARQHYLAVPDMYYSPNK